MEKKLLYFGCMRQPGHHLWAGDYDQARPSTINIPHIGDGLLGMLDSTFCPPAKVKEGLYLESIVPPVRIIAWWDRSVDNRYGSNSTLVGYGYESGEQMLDDAKNIFPSVMNRQPRPTKYEPNANT
jgi:hypothetical protein